MSRSAWTSFRTAAAKVSASLEASVNHPGQTQEIERRVREADEPCRGLASAGDWVQLVASTIVHMGERLAGRSPDAGPVSATCSVDHSLACDRSVM